MSDIGQFIDHMIATYPQYRILEGHYNGQKIWIKRHLKSKANTWHHVQYLLTRLIPLPVFRPTVSSIDALHHEPQRLSQFKQKGIAVPDVLYSSGTVFAVNDVGDQLRDLVDASTDPQKRKDILTQAIQALQKLHHAGLAHGRPLLKDMTLHGGQIFFIDLEEDPTAVMTLAQAQARDIWLFLNGSARYLKDEPIVLRDLYQLYAQDADPQALHELRTMVRWLRPIRFFAEYAVMPFAGNDVRLAVTVNKALEELL